MPLQAQGAAGNLNEMRFNPSVSLTQCGTGIRADIVLDDISNTIFNIRLNGIGNGSRTDCITVRQSVHALRPVSMILIQFKQNLAPF